ncbi:MAG: hypothetical protein GX766_10855 [Firmicutes bacterium]|jgi:hypothetical protein|nr:hypothetical protein [Bacillota bacterium]
MSKDFERIPGTEKPQLMKPQFDRAEVTLRDIKEIKSLTVNASTEVDEVNRYLSNGWILIDKYKPDDYTVVFVMGRVN